MVCTVDLPKPRWSDIIDSSQEISQDCSLSRAPPVTEESYDDQGFDMSMDGFGCKLNLSDTTLRHKANSKDLVSNPKDTGLAAESRDTEPDMELFDATQSAWGTDDEGAEASCQLNADAPTFIPTFSTAAFVGQLSNVRHVEPTPPPTPALELCSVPPAPAPPPHCHNTHRPRRRASAVNSGGEGARGARASLVAGAEEVVAPPPALPAASQQASRQRRNRSGASTQAPPLKRSRGPIDVEMGPPPIPDATEEEWQHRIEKRTKAVACVKDSPEYAHYQARRSRAERRKDDPHSPEPTDRTVSKRQWEFVVQQWRAGLRNFYAADKASELE